jgi:hypothetical protein
VDRSDPWVKNLGCPILIELNFLLWRSHEPTEGGAIGLIVMKPGVWRQLAQERSSRACTIAALHVATAVLHHLGVVQVLKHRTITSKWGYLRGKHQRPWCDGSMAVTPAVEDCKVETDGRLTCAASAPCSTFLPFMALGLLTVAYHVVSVFWTFHGAMHALHGEPGARAAARR